MIFLTGLKLDDSGVSSLREFVEDTQPFLFLYTLITLLCMSNMFWSVFKETKIKLTISICPKWQQVQKMGHTSQIKKIHFYEITLSVRNSVHDFQFVNRHRRVAFHWLILFSYSDFIDCKLTKFRRLLGNSQAMEDSADTTTAVTNQSC